MAILIKDGVTFAFHPAGFRILEVLKQVSTTLKVDLTLTSGSDGTHSGPSDPHHSGQAYDLRSKSFNNEVKANILAAIRKGLGPKFFAFLEAPNTPNEHFHIQRVKGSIYTILDYLDA